MGGSKTVVQAAPPPPPPPAPAPPPSPGETAAQAIQAQIDAIPKLLAAEQKFGPQFSQTQLEQLKEFGPQFTETALELQEEFGPRLAEVQAASAPPEIKAAQRNLTDFLEGDDEEEFNALKAGLVKDVRAAHSQRGLGDVSPLGSVDEAVQVARLKESLKARRLNIALSTAGRVPIAAAPQVQPTTGRIGQVATNVTPQDIFGAQASINQFRSSIFNTQGGIFGAQTDAATQLAVAQSQQRSDLLGGIIGGVGTVAGAKIQFGCISEATLIDTPEGLKPVEEIKTGEMVFDQDGNLVEVFMKAEYHERKASSRYVSITMESGAVLVISHNHTLNGKRAFELKRGEPVGTEKVQSISSIPAPDRSFDLLTGYPKFGYSSRGIPIDSMIPALSHAISRQHSQEVA